MKLSLLTLAASIAAASAVDCDVTKLSPLLSDPKIATCTSESGFSFTALTTPTAENLPKLCASAACKSVLTAVKGLGLGDCTLIGMKLETDLIKPIQTACASASGSTTVTKTVTATGSTSGSTTSTATVGASSNTTKTATSTSSSNSTSSGSAAANSSSEDVKSPSTATTPAPTVKKSAASSMAMATSAVVLALTASFF